MQHQTTVGGGGDFLKAQVKGLDAPAFVFTGVHDSGHWVALSLVNVNLSPHMVEVVSVSSAAQCTWNGWAADSIHLVLLLGALEAYIGWCANHPTFPLAVLGCTNVVCGIFPAGSSSFLHFR